MCAVCGRVLDYADGQGWMHSLQDQRSEDHPAVPVPFDSVPMRGRCDFCNLDYPTMIIPARNFEIMPGHMSNGDWGACDICCALIEGNRWNRLIDRAVQTTNSAGPMTQDQLRQSLAHLYKALRKNITGSPKPLEQA